MRDAAPGSGVAGRSGPATGPDPERGLAALAAALAGPAAALTAAERALVPERRAPIPCRVDRARLAIARGDDPLGDTFCRLRSPQTRRARGAVYTPRPIVDAMVAWASRQTAPARIVDPGAGSGRFLLAAARAFPGAELTAVEIDPLAALILRANAAVLGQARRLTVIVDDYRAIGLPPIDGATLFLGNPPWVRHHGIAPEWKDWFAETAAACGLRGSKLAGLHVHFFLKTHALAKPGDYGALVTSAEWLDVNYGETIRKLFVGGLGGGALHVIAPAAMPFADAATTGAIACFRTGRDPRAIRFRPVEALSELGSLRGGRWVARSRLEAARRWSPFLRPAAPGPSGRAELGEAEQAMRESIRELGRGRPNCSADAQAEALAPVATGRGNGDERNDGSAQRPAAGPRRRAVSGTSRPLRKTAPGQQWRPRGFRRHRERLGGAAQPRNPRRTAAPRAGERARSRTALDYTGRLLDVY